MSPAVAPDRAASTTRVWPVSGWAWVVLMVVAGIAWVLLPPAPNYDTATHLVWAHEIWEGRQPGIGDAAAPTLHPLWLLIALLLSFDQDGGATLMQFLTVIAFAVVIACAYRLAADVAGRIAGAVAALATGSSFALLLLAFKAYVDVPFLAVVLTAVVVERAWRPMVAGGTGAEAPSAQPVGAGRLTMPVLMFIAGLLRPEAWAIGLLLIALRLVRGGVVRDLVLSAAIVVAAPVVWALTDLALTGDPLHSLTGTQALAEELGRKTGLANAPRELLVQLGDLARPPIAAAGLVGVVLAVRFAGWRPLLLPLATLAASAAGFLLVGALGLPLLQRYLQLPAVLLCVFAGIATALVVATARGRRLRLGLGSLAADDLHSDHGHEDDDLHRDRGHEDPTASPGEPAPVSAPLRTLAAAALAVGVLGAAGYLVLKADSFRIVGEGVLREADWQRDGAALLRDPRVRAAADCGPITLPTYRFVPELTLRARLDAGRVVSRSTALGGAGPQPRGVAIVIDGPRNAKTRLGWAAGVPRTTNQIPPGFTEVARRGPFVAAANCG